MGKWQGAVRFVEPRHETVTPGQRYRRFGGGHLSAAYNLNLSIHRADPPEILKNMAFKHPFNR
jgi:hypothetical protein